MPIELPSIFVAISRSPILAVGIPLVLGSSSGLITKSGMVNWYEFLIKPAGQPPRLAFPIAWTLLYASMGFASHLIVKSRDAAVPGTKLRATADLALQLYWLQYGLNLTWTPLFFGAHLVGASLANIVLLTPLNYALTYYASQVDIRTTYLLAPYCAWLTYASYLNGAIWWLNFGPGKPDKGKGKAL